MALTINTNMASISAQHSLNTATNSLNSSIKKMTTGYKINSASDDAAGYAVATKMETNLNAVSVAQSNTALGSSLLSTVEQNYGLVSTHLQRIRDLTEQAANGTYSSDSLKAIKSEIGQRLSEIDRVTNSTNYNGIYLLSGDATAGKPAASGINLQVGITSSSNSVITLDKSLFAATTSSALTWKSSGYSTLKNADGNLVSGAITANLASGSNDTFATECAGLGTGANDGTNGATQMLAVIDAAISNITTRTTTVGVLQNRIDSASDALTVQSDNLTSSLSTVRDTDVASESSKYLSAQILQQASATLLSTANQTPSIALNLL